MGNCKVERAKLSPGFIPMGMKEYGGIIYIASYNVDTKECEVGSFPSPERDITGSDKIGNQTGLQDGHFFTSDYSIPIVREDEEFDPELLTSKIQKLNEESVLMLNPGDKFITTYQVNDVTGQAGQEVVTDANFFDFFNNSATNKKLFSINFYKIDSGNNVVKIPNNEVRTIQYRTDIEEDEYIYYTQNSSGNIAVGVEMNSLLYFSAAARETSKLKDSKKSIHIEAVGESDSSVKFKGIRVDLTRNDVEKESFHVVNQGTSDKVAVNVTDLQQDDEIKCDITPYSDYGYLSNLLQSFNLKMGQSITGQQVNNIFKWRVDPIANRIEIDFDFLLETENTFKLFIEFYDPWSNVSTIRNVPAPSIYGPMRLVMNLQNEPRTMVFDAYPDSGTVSTTAQRGGIPHTKLAISNNEVAVPILINPAQSNNKLLIRNDNSLRKNHFYIVRICGYEETAENGEVVRTYHDAYRALYTNTAYNELYEEQANVDPSSNSYRPLFVEEPYPLEKLKYTISKDNPAPMSYTKTFVTPVPDDSVLPRTRVADKDYLFSIERAPIGGNIVLNTKWKAEQNYSINLLKPDDFIYGSLKDGLLTVKTSNQNVPVPVESIQDAPDINTNLSMDTTGVIEIPNLNTGASRYSIKLNVDTNRPIQGNYVKIPVNGSFTKTTLDQLYHYPGDVGCQGCLERLPCSFYYYRTDTRSDDGTPCNGEKRGLWIFMSPYDTVPTNWKNKDYANRIKEIGEGNNDYSEILAPQKLLDLKATGKTLFSIGMGGYMTDSIQNRTLLVLVDADKRMFGFLIGKYRGGGSYTMFDVKNSLSKFYFYKYNSTSTSTRYYVSNDLLFYGTQNPTKLVNIVIDIVSGWSSVSAKTYVYNSHFQGLVGATEFSTANLNTLIANAKSRAPEHNVIAGAEDIKDDYNFIPYLTPASNISDTVFKFQLNDTDIALAPDEEIFRMLNESEDAYFNYDIPEPDFSTKSIQTDSDDSNDKLFCKYMMYNPTSDSLEVNRAEVPGKIDVIATNYRGNTTNVKMIDATASFTFQ